jgi:hypothetical protein
VTCSAHDNCGNSNTCSFQITVAPPQPRPQLTINLITNKVVLSWPAAITNYALESTAVLAPAQWSSVTNVPTVSGGTRSVTLDIGDVSNFFRLRSP